MQFFLFYFLNRKYYFQNNILIYFMSIYLVFSLVVVDL
jgi:hypothetical protein